MDWLGWLERDVRYGIRSLRKDRGVALAAVLTLALGIGATTVIFSVVDNVLLEPFPYRAADRLIQPSIHDSNRPDANGRPVFSVPEFLALSEQNHVFEDTIGAANVDVLYTVSEATWQFDGAFVTGNTFDFLGVPPLRGRSLIPADAESGAPPVCVISYRLWNREFNLDPQLLGRTLTLNGEARTLVGIMPPRFLFWGADVWLPMDLKAGGPAGDLAHIWPMGRLKTDATLKSAAADLEVIVAGLARVHPNAFPKRFTVVTQSLMEGVVGRGQFKHMLFILSAAVGMLLLIACSNVANLLLARAAAREKEIAVRAALGASRGRLIAQLLVESLLLAAAGCLAGCLLAFVAVRGVVATIPAETIPAETVIRMNPRVLLFTLGVTMITTLLSGLAPALHGVRGQLGARLNDGSKGAGTSTGHGRLRSVQVIAQVALSIVLLVGAGLMMQSLTALQQVDLGFNPVNILSARVPLPRGRYDTAEQKKAFFRQTLARVTALPGVIAATETTTIPLSEGFRTELTVPGKLSGEHRFGILQMVSETYFSTLGLRLVRGQLFSEADVESARRVAVINQALARNCFAKNDPIGHRIKFNALDTLPETPHDAYFDIVGVIADAKNSGLREAVEPEGFVPYTISGFGERGILMRTVVDPDAMLTSVRREIWAVDPNVALTNAGSLESFLRRFYYAQPRFGLFLLSAFAAIGLAMVAVGLFSVMAYSVTLQTREIGIRMALGAKQGSVVRMVLVKGLTLIAAGVLLGELLSLALSRLMASQIFGVSAHDPFTFGAVVVVLVAVGVPACLLPARRAAQVDPIVALRYE